ncbi:hypothetical protein Clacol_006144 [Clathrus columnatus]|uniref:Cytochrome P450 n=1 Tax=Clathrus columnatus TaxID=1419009 RepID=A0AAV5AG15_9AGAM|nr:hypothetical protein Clacol_006144 [Clathrus columnatus]
MSASKLPGPSGLPLIGNLLQLRGTDLWLKFVTWTQQYGPLFFLNAGGKPTIVIGDHKVAIDLLEERGGLYSGRPSNITVNEYMTRGLVFGFAPDNDLWKRLRTSAIEALNNEMSKEFPKYQNIEAVLLVRDLLKTPESYIAHVTRAVDSSLLSMIYGLPPSSESSPTYITISTIASTFLRTAAQRSLVDYFPVLNYIPASLSSWKRFAEKVYTKSDDLFERLYKDVEKQTEAGNIIPSVSTSLVRDPVHKDLTPKEKAWLAGTLFVAGSQTTSRQMQWFIPTIALHPDIQVKAQKQLDDVVGRERMPNLNDYEKLPYVQALVKEILRWRDVAPFGVPHSVSDVKNDVYEGHIVPKGSDCIVNVWGLNHDKTVYGPDADSFNPERYLNEQGQIQIIASRETKGQGHCSFGFGRRYCAGPGVAINNLFVQMACILWSFNVGPEIDENGNPIPIDVTQVVDDRLTMYPLRTNCCKFTPRFAGVEEIIKKTLEASGLGY